MRYLAVVSLAAIIFSLATSTALAGDMRCGSDIVNIKDSSFMVIQKCGEPITRTHVGYTIDENKKRELVVEEWVYGPKNSYYYLTMVGGRVAEIRSERM